MEWRHDHAEAFWGLSHGCTPPSTTVAAQAVLIDRGLISSSIGAGGRGGGAPDLGPELGRERCRSEAAFYQGAF